MHITIMILYGLTCWLAAIAYAIITRSVSVTTVALAGPFIISGAVVFLVALDLALCHLTSAVRRWLIARRGSANG